MVDHLADVVLRHTRARVSFHLSSVEAAIVEHAAMIDLDAGDVTGVRRDDYRAIAANKMLVNLLKGDLTFLNKAELR